MRNNTNYIMKMENSCTENNANDEIIKAFSEMMESSFKKDIRRKTNNKSKKNIKFVSLVRNDKNDELAETLQNAMKRSFAEDTRRKINWEAREKRVKIFRLENPLATQ